MTDNQYEKDEKPTASANAENHSSPPSKPDNPPAKPAKSGRGLAFFALLLALAAGGGTGYLWYLWDQYQKAQQAESATLDARLETAMEKVVAQRETDIEDLQARLQAQQQETETLQEELTALQEKTQSLNTSDQNLQSDIAGMQTELRNFQGALQTLKGGLEIQQGNIEIQKNDVRTVQADVRTLQNDIQSLQGDVQNLREITETQQGNTLVLKNEIQALQSETQALQESLAALEGATQTLGESLAQLADTQKNDTLLMKNALQAFKVDVEGVQGAMGALNGEMQALKQVSEAQRGDTVILKNQVQALQAGTLALENNLGTLDEQLAMAVQARRDAVAELNERIKNLLVSQQGLQTTLDTIKTIAAQGGDVNALPLSEVEYLLRIAEHKLQLQRNVEGALQALRTAQQRLAGMEESGLLVIQQMIDKDIATLRGIDIPDRSALSHKILEMEQRIDNLPLRIDTILAELKTRVKPQIGESEMAGESGQSWWKQISSAAWEQFKDIVVIRHDRISEPPLIPVEEEYFLIENLRLELESMRMALLAGDAESFKASNQKAQRWIETYFDTDSQAVSEFLSELKALHNIQINPYIPNISTTLGAFNEFMQQRAPLQSMLPQASASDIREARQ